MVVFHTAFHGWGRRHEHNRSIAPTRMDLFVVFNDALGRYFSDFCGCQIFGVEEEKVELVGFIAFRAVYAGKDASFVKELRCEGLITLSLPGCFVVMVFDLGWTPQVASLSFIPVAVGCLGGFLTRLYDHHHLANRKKSGKPLGLEDKLLGFSLARCW